MTSINSQEIRYFYRNIVKNGNVYRIKYNNKDYGEFKKLSEEDMVNIAKNIMF